MRREPPQPKIRLVIDETDTGHIYIRFRFAQLVVYLYTYRLCVLLTGSTRTLSLFLNQISYHIY